MPAIAAATMRLLLLSEARVRRMVREGAQRDHNSHLSIAVFNLQLSGAFYDAALSDRLVTIAESGLPGFEVENWQGLLMPAGTPREIISKLHAEMIRILNLPDVKDRLYGQGFEISTSTPEQFGMFLNEEIRKWAAVTKAQRISVQ